MKCVDIFVKNLGDNESYEKEVDEYFKIYGKVFSFIRKKTIINYISTKPRLEANKELLSFDIDKDGNIIPESVKDLHQNPESLNY